MKRWLSTAQALGKGGGLMEARAPCCSVWVVSTCEGVKGREPADHQPSLQVRRGGGGL